MSRETLLLIALQSGALFVALWGIFRLVPSIPANAKAWMWRLAFLKPLLSLLPFATVSLPLLPEPEVPQGLRVEGQGLRIEEPILIQPAQPSTPNPQPLALDPLLALWILGVAGVSVNAIRGMRKALKIANEAQPVTNEYVLYDLYDLLEKAGVTKKPALLQSKKAASAMLIGGRRYAIVLPEKVLDTEDVRLMLAHEVAHIVRRDLFWFGLASAAQSLFFFNPMVWVAARCSRLDHESATDLHASRLAGVPIQRYADMLLRATVVARPSFAPGALPVAESYRSIHRRLEAMKHFNSKPTLLRRTATAALALLTLSLIPAYEVVAAGAPKMQDPPVVVTQSAQPAQAKKVQKKAAAPKDVKWFVTTNGELKEVKGKPGQYKVYERKGNKWVEVKNPGVVWRVQTVKGKKKTVIYRVETSAAVPAKVKAPGKPGAPKLIVVPGDPARLLPSGVHVAPQAKPAGTPPRAGAPGMPALAAPAGQGAPALMPAQGNPPVRTVTVNGAPALMPAQGSAPARTVTVQGESITVKPGQTITVTGQNITIVNQGGAITVNGQNVNTAQPVQVSGRGYLRTTTVPYKAFTNDGKAVKLNGQGVVSVPYTVQGTLNTRTGQVKTTAPQMINGAKLYKGALLGQGSLYRGTTLSPITVRGKDGKYRVIYGTATPKKKGTKPEKPAPDNHHGATDPTYSGYSGV